MSPSLTVDLVNNRYFLHAAAGGGGASGEALYSSGVAYSTDTLGL